MSLASFASAKKNTNRTLPDQKQGYKKKNIKKKIIVRGETKEETGLLLKLARKLNIGVRKLTSEETEQMGMILSINEGIRSGLLDEDEKTEFIKNLNSK